MDCNAPSKFIVASVLKSDMTFNFPFFSVVVCFCLFRHLLWITEHSRATYTTNRNTQQYEHCVHCNYKCINTSAQLFPKPRFQGTWPLLNLMCHFVCVITLVQNQHIPTSNKQGKYIELLNIILQCSCVLSHFTGAVLFSVNNDLLVMCSRRLMCVFVQHLHVALYGFVLSVWVHGYKTQLCVLC
jgi:hypothetical protein